MAKTMTDQLAPDASDIQDMAEKIVGERGHARALKKHLLLLPEMLSKSGGDYRKAVAMAHTQVVSDYKLVV